MHLSQSFARDPVLALSKSNNFKQLETLNMTVSSSSSLPSSPLFLALVLVACLGSTFLGSSVTAWTTAMTTHSKYTATKGNVKNNPFVAHGRRMSTAAASTSGDGYDDFVSREDWQAMSQEERNAINAKRGGGGGGGASAVAVAVATPTVSSADADATDDSEIVKGTVKWFDSTKGFGFITIDDDVAEKDVFVHQTALQAEGFRALEDGASVEFQIKTDEKTGRTVAAKVTGPDGQPLPRGFAYKQKE
jgi:CspA family cold shock protein